MKKQAKVEITLKHNTDREVRTKIQLNRLLKEYNLSKFIFTKKIQIDEQRRYASSSPVLTLHTRYSNNDHRLLTVFIHEQMHWFLMGRKQQAFKAIEELKTIFPIVPIGFPKIAGKNEFSTYVHLIVNFLEYEAMKELVGEEMARKMITNRPLYAWIYKTVLNEGVKIKAIVEKYNLKLST